MRAFWPLAGTILVGGVAVATVFLGPASCSSQGGRIGLPPIGQKITLMPAAINDDGPIKAIGVDYKAVRLNVMWGARPIRSGATLRLYKARDGAPAWSKTWDELAQAHTATGCDDDESAYLKDLESAAMICDGSLKIEDYVAADAVDEKGEVRKATSWSTFAITDDVLGVAIQLY